MRVRNHPRPKRLLDDWVRPMYDATAPELAGHNPHVALDALLAAGAAYARISEQSLADFEAWGREAWDRCFNLPDLRMLPTSREAYTFPATLPAPAEELADRWIQKLVAQKTTWAEFGSLWAPRVASAQVASFCLITAARVVHRTNTGYTPWVAALRAAWAQNPFEIEVQDALPPADPAGT